MTRIFLDATCWVVAAGSPTGGSMAILLLARQGRLRIVASPEIMLECFVAYQPDLPGCMAQGDTADEAKASLAALIPGYLDLMRQDGLRELPPDPDWPPPPPRRRPREGLQARTIRLPAEVWQRLDDTARAHLRSANAEAECAVRAWVERQT